MSFNNISFILHQPQLSENIGACARAVKNFNFKTLIILYDVQKEMRPIAVIAPAGLPVTARFIQMNIPS